MQGEAHRMALRRTFVMIISIIFWIILGAVLGYLARLIVPGPDPMSFLSTVLLGIAGQVVAGLVFGLLFGVGVGWIVGLLFTIGLLLVSRRTGIGRRSARL
jgi:uncharacterized membrane protein YeaQ/YmgE (transglycosylase-associated protein family)